MSFFLLGLFIPDSMGSLLFKSVADLSISPLLLFVLHFVCLAFRAAVFYFSPLCTGFHCCGAFLHLLHAARWLHGEQSLHQPQPHLLHHHFHCLHLTKDTGRVSDWLIRYRWCDRWACSLTNNTFVKFDKALILLPI